MKKTTKILLVLAAVVAMTIGAVSTVMAAEYPTVATWGSDKTAKDADGNAITNGWAVSEAGLWYFFDNGAYLTNSFVTYGGDVYFLGGEGAMCTNWVEFDIDTEVKYNNVTYSHVAEAFDVTTLGSSNSVPFSSDNDKAYETLWCYFNADGTMVTDKWVEDCGLWYYMDDAFCLINEWAVELPKDNSTTKTALYGFGGNGNMHVGWIKVKVKNATTGVRPWESDKNAGYAYLYYDNAGVIAQGWKKIDNVWYYFAADDTYASLMVTDKLVLDGTNAVYFDGNGAMLTGIQTLSAGSSSDRTINAFSITDGYVLEANAAENIVIEKKKSATFNFKGDGRRQTGIQGDYYYAQAKEDANVCIIDDSTVNPVTTKEFGFAKSEKNVGAKLSGNFFFIKKAGDPAKQYTDAEIYYFSAGKMVKNTAVTFGNTTLAFKSDGKMLVLEAGKNATVNGTKYFNTSDCGTIDLGVVYTGVTSKKSVVTIVDAGNLTANNGGKYYAGQKIVVTINNVEALAEILVDGVANDDLLADAADGSFEYTVGGDVEITIVKAEAPAATSSAIN